MPLHVTIDLSPTVQGHAGLGRYAGEIARAINQYHPEIALNLFYNTPDEASLPDYLSHIPHTVVNQGNKPWRMRVLLSSMLRWSMDKTFGAKQVFHATNHLLAHFNQASTVYTLHDLIFLRYPQYHMFYNRWYLTVAMPRYLQAAKIIITPSDCSKQDAMHYYKLPEEKFRVIYEAPAPTFHPFADKQQLETIRHKYNLPQQFILHVGTIEPRKNLSRLLDSFKPLLVDWPDLKLVLIGKKGWLYNDFFTHLQTIGLEDQVIFPGFVEEADLPAMYQLATLFVYPSLYEGFGLPPIEAMACGTPVISSNSSSLPEVVGQAGLLINPTDTQALHQAMRRVLSDESLQQELSERGQEQALRFSWQKAVDEHVAIYRQLDQQNLPKNGNTDRTFPRSF